LSTLSRLAVLRGPFLAVLHYVGHIGTRDRSCSALMHAIARTVIRYRNSTLGQQHASWQRHPLVVQMNGEIISTVRCPLLLSYLNL